MAQTTGFRHGVAAKPRHTRFRADIQGLRALAVLAVIADHMLHWPAGGFVGVDVFFVISGYMITTIMLREHEATGRISFWGFYKRRIKRLLPASILTIALTVAAGWLVFAKTRATETLWDGLAALFFSSNWRYAAAGTDYFQQDIPPSPLQHFWSLGVEEQFYFVWPFLLVAVFYVAGTGFRRGRAFAAAAMLIIIAASLAWSMIETSANPTWAYFSTGSRVWELGAGALLAVCAGAFINMPTMVRPILAWVGLAGIIVSMFIIIPSDAFPAPWALLPVLATAVVIAANIGGDQRGLGALTNKASVYIGNISFSLYLWHFPVIIFTGVFLKPDDPASYGVIVALIALLSIGSYHGIEDRIRKSSWLDGGRLRVEHLKYIGLGVLALVTAGVVAFALVKTSAPVPSIPRAAPLATTGAEAPKGAMTASIEAALAATEWPELSPAISEVGTNSKAPELGVAGCLNPENLTDTQQCTFNPQGKISAAVVGDSIGLSWLPGVRAALEPAGYSVHGVGLSNCPFVNVDISIPNDPETTGRCNEGRAEIYKQIRESSPDLLIVSDSVAGIVSLASGAKGDTAQQEWSLGLVDAIQQAQAGGTRIVVLSPNPTGKSVAECYNNFSKPADCVSPISQAWKDKNAADTTGAKTAGVIYVDTSPWFCLADRCPIFADGAPIRWDGMHLTEAYAKKLAPQLAEILLPGSS